jgi:DNA helicase-2/ATP-dependent DNA helicase PcrA
LTNLNEAQREAVEALDGPVLVLAGAGTGKTRVLTTRLAHLLAEGRCYPGQVLAVTFTNKAAREMRYRVAALVGPRMAESMNWLGTFHAVSAKILRRHAELVGLQSNFTILDTDDQIRLLKQLIQAANIDEKRWPARMLASLIDRWKNRGLTPDRVGAGEAEAYANGRGADFYRLYQDRLKTLNAVDFGDLLLHCLTIFQTNADVLSEWQRRFRYILVDEYQDTNVAQYLWLRILAQKHHNICCVGDDDQSIYGWRGAEVGNILRFESDFPGATVVRLEQNYRSTPEILGAASGLIAANSGRLGKTLWTTANEGEKISVKGVWDGAEEARAVGENIEDMRREGHNLNQIAVLVRAGFQTREFEDRFLTLGLPYRIVGGPRFYERQEIRDAMAYLRLVAQPADDLAFERIVNLPKRGLGKAAMQALHMMARAEGLPLLRAAASLVETDELRPQARRSLAGFVADVERWRADIDRVPHVELVETILEESGYVAMWQQDKSVEAPGRLENLSELVRAMDSFDSLAGFLEHVSLVMDNEEGGDEEKVSIMTLHAAKGLEFDNVFLPGWEEGMFPNQRALDESGTAGLEEERRLAYVGITRARKRAQILFAANRLIFGQWQSSIPSRFIDDLPGEYVHFESRPGVYEGGHNQAGFSQGSFNQESFGNDWSSGGGGNFKPSWSSAKDRRKKRQPRMIEGRAREVRKEKPSCDYSVGDRVFHEKFGYGQVIEVDGNKLQIDFEHTTPKRVMASFVRAA